jgi:glutathione S-transferase
VLWAAQELGLAYEFVPYRFDGPEIKAAPFLAINPNGAIPAIDDDGFPLWESLAINLYLSRKAGKLWPADLRGEGLAFQWTLFAATELEMLIGQWFYHTKFLPPEKRKPELVADSEAKLPKKFAVLEAALASSPWLAGPQFTIADLNVAAVLFRAPQFGLDPWPKLKDWHARCTTRPAALEALKLREAALA